MLMKRGHEIALIVTARPLRSTGRRRISRLWPTGCACRLFTPLGSRNFRDDSSLGPFDIGVSMNYPGVIPSEVIDLSLGDSERPRSDLPPLQRERLPGVGHNQRRGASACASTRWWEENWTAATSSSATTTLTADTTITEVYGWMASRTPDLFAQALDLLAADPSYVLERQSKNPADALRCYPRAPEDGYIDWNRSAVEILRLINASTKPYAGAFTWHKGEMVRIWSARMGALPCPSCFVPGQVLWKNDDGSGAVGTGDSGVLLLDEVQKEAGEPCKAAEMVRSLRERFGGSGQ